jgi:coenzyme Q-binding protein COQ10
MINESFTTGVHLDPVARTILVEYLDGPFTFLENRWHFQPKAEAACDIEFYIAYEFRSRLFERLIGGLFAKAIEKYTGAFETRADAVYRHHAPALASQQ